MDNWELLVQDYLCLDRRLFLNSQYDIGGPKWNANADFLALDFSNKMVWMVEVSTSGQQFAKKVNSFEEEYRPRISHQINEAGVLPSSIDWKFGIWLFPKMDFCGKAFKLLSDKGFEPERGLVTPLEKVAADLLNGEAWKDRRDNLAEIDSDRGLT